MRTRRIIFLAFLSVLLLASCRNLPDTTLRYTLEGEDCPFADFAEYGLWVPGTAVPLRGVMILQHGCTMEQFGITKPYDLQYQAFARKWNLAILETAIHGDCHVWHHPESGSAAALMKVLGKASDELGRPELPTVPWLIWGHSSGGHWTLAMLRDYPERILAAVCYSAAWDPQWDYQEETARIPVLLRHAGPDDAPFAACEATANHTFSKLRAMGAPACIVYNHGENHNYSQLRHMMIPFFESVLRTVSPGSRWLGDPGTLEIFPEDGFDGDKSSLCLFLDEGAAKAWQEYSTTNDVHDRSLPPVPDKVTVIQREDSIVVNWKAGADPESGIGHFDVSIDGALAARVPETGEYQSFDRNGDNTFPTEPAPMEVILPCPSGKKHKVTVTTVNQAGLSSYRTATFRAHNWHKRK